MRSECSIYVSHEKNATEETNPTEASPLRCVTSPLTASFGSLHCRCIDFVWLGSNLEISHSSPMTRVVNNLYLINCTVYINKSTKLIERIVIGIISCEEKIRIICSPDGYIVQTSLD